MEAWYQLTAPVETSKFVLTTHCDVSITTSKEHLVNNRTLLTYFKGAFRQIQLVKMLFKLIHH